MRPVFIFIFFALISFPAFSQKDIINDPDVERRPLSESFNSIKISDGIDLFLSQSDKEQVAISAGDAHTKEAIKTVIDKGVLHIYYKGDKGWAGNWKNRKLRAYVSFRTLERLQASGAADIQVSGTISGNNLLMALSGSSDFKGAVSVSNLSIELSGASDVLIAGKATIVSIVSSGASDVKGYDLVTDICTANASGASDINITVNKEMTANASGASDIFYKGTAVLKASHTGGASTIAKKS